jgi:hypothetical protein
MRKTIFIFILAVATGFYGKAQYSLHEYVLMQNTATMGTSLKSFDNQYTDITGDAFLSNEWLNGQAISVNGTKFTDLKFKVDLYKSKIFMNFHDTIFDLTDTKNISAFILFPGNSVDTSKKLVFSNQFQVPGVKGNLFQVLGTGAKVSLLKSATKDVQDAQSGLYSAKEKRFMDYVHYYLLKDGASTDIKLSKKTFEKMFPPADAAKVEDYLKQQHLSLSDEEGWAAAIDFYNKM